jgi:hypothetical protein
MPTFRFRFGKSGGIGRMTPEQQAVIDKLGSEEITPEEAAEQLGGHAHVFEFGTGPKGEGDASPLPAPTPPALADPALVRGLHALLAVVTGVLAVLVAFGDAAAHDHAVTSVVFAVLSLLPFGALAAGTGLAEPARGTVLATIPLFGAWIVLDWGLLVGSIGHWSIYLPGLFAIAIAVSLVILALLLALASRRTRNTLDALGRRRR